jgi:amino acid transporter
VAQLPWAILGTVCTSTILYLMLAVGLALMVCPSIACPATFFLPVRGTTQCLDLFGTNPNCPPGGCVCPPIVAPAPGTGVPAPPPQVTNADCFQAVNFISAFLATGLEWMQYIVSLAALAGIVTALTVGLFSLSRIVMAASRDWMLPPFLARISPRTQTPLMAQMVFGTIIGGLLAVAGPGHLLPTA